jgi:exodeoxyribonuclease VIII
MNNVMVDLETLGNGSNSVIIALGAVEFDHATGELGREFYENIDAQSCVDFGLQMDVSTVMWWMQQSDEARAAFKKSGVSLPVVLSGFERWLPHDAVVWGNGASFDNVILSNAYRKTHGEQPWKFWNDRCYRTLKTLRPDIPFVRGGTHHNALDDAKTQAVHAIAILQALEKSNGTDTRSES